MSDIDRHDQESASRKGVAVPVHSGRVERVVGAAAVPVQSKRDGVSAWRGWGRWNCDIAVGVPDQAISTEQAGNRAIEGQLGQGVILRPLGLAVIAKGVLVVIGRHRSARAQLGYLRRLRLGVSAQREQLQPFAGERLPIGHLLRSPRAETVRQNFRPRPTPGHRRSISLRLHQPADHPPRSCSLVCLGWCRCATDEREALTVPGLDVDLLGGLLGELALERI